MKLHKGRLGFISLTKGLHSDYDFYNKSRRGLHSTLCLRKKSDPKKISDVEAVANGSNANYIESLYTKWAKDPKSVDASWDSYFGSKSKKASKTSETKKKHFSNKSSTDSATKPSFKAPNADWKYIDDHLVVQAIIRAYQTRGHFAADLDPLGIVGPHGQSLSVDNKKLQATRSVLRQHFDYAFNDLNSIFKLPNNTSIGGTDEFLPLKEILERLEKAYCGHIGVEYMMITSYSKCTWIRNQFEKPNSLQFAPEEKKLILERLTRATGFENFLAKKFTSEKRFGLEGCDIMIPVMKEIIDRSNKLGVESIYIGMAHRGRLNVLSNICRKPIADILSQFHGLMARDSGSGDVKYHLGVFTERINRQTNGNVRITVVANPSHLEFVNPVVLGKARADMLLRGDYMGNRVLPILVHGDASFCGQGVVYESIHMSDLPAYTTHGTIHIVANNQVGFTTDPRFSRSSRYCTDVARVVNAPIFHVNADDPEACIHCARVAAEWRAKYHKDVVIDIVGYRRNGHNEADEPMFTQPLMYQRIRKLKPCMVKYAEKLIKEGIIKMEEYQKMVADYDKICNDAYEESKKMKTFKYSHWLDSPWPGFFQGRNRLKMCPTGVNVKVLEHIGNIFSSPPPPEQKFEVHRGILRILGLRKNMVKECVADWSLGEAFAIGTLLKDGIHVRISGQDVERGTFSHRHHVLHHQSADKVRYNSLQHLYADQAVYDVYNSSLSECAIMGFDLGYSLANPHTLVIWEAQFGDFVNTAQPIIDQFLASGETKWVRQSGMVIFLPHSMEGMGPEHSSGRMERFLQLSDDDPDVFPDICDSDFVVRQIMNTNWIVTHLTTPANLFHALRRQVAFGFRKPLINFAPKSVLRHPMARSPFSDFNECSEFKRVISEEGPAAEKKDCVQKLIFCTGKVYYDLFKERHDHDQDDSVAIIRIEQICPFPYDLVLMEIEAYPKADLIWAQEEHKNQGAWPYVQNRFDTTILQLKSGETRPICYHGRAPNSSPSTGNKVQHYQEYDEFMTSIFGELTEENKKRLAEIKKTEQEEALKATQASISKAKESKSKEGESKEGKEKDAKPKAASPPNKDTPTPTPKRSSPTESKPLAASPPHKDTPNPQRSSPTESKPLAASPPHKDTPSPQRSSPTETKPLAASPPHKDTPTSKRSSPTGAQYLVAAPPASSPKDNAKTAGKSERPRGIINLKRKSAKQFVDVEVIENSVAELFKRSEMLHKSAQKYLEADLDGIKTKDELGENKEKPSESKETQKSSEQPRTEENSSMSRQGAESGSSTATTNDESILAKKAKEDAEPDEPKKK